MYILIGSEALQHKIKLPISKSIPTILSSGWNIELLPICFEYFVYGTTGKNLYYQSQKDTE